MRHQRPDNFGRKDSPIEYDVQGKPRLPAQMRTGYAGGGSTFGAVQLDDPGFSGAGQLASALGVMQSAGYGPASRGPGFDAEYYLRNNPGVEDAARAFGMDPYQGAYTHYDLYGRREGRAGAAPRADPAAAPQLSMANLTPVGGGGSAPSFNAGADLAAQQAAGAATLAQMRGSGPSPAAAPAAPAAPRPTFTPTAGANAAAAAPPLAMAGGGAVERNPMDPISDAQRRARGEDSVSYGFEKIPKAPDRFDLKRKELLSFPLEKNLPESMRSDEANAVLRADPRGLGGGVTWGANAGGAVPSRRAGYAGGGPVEEMGPRQSMNPQSMIPPAGSGPALNRFGMNRGRTPMKRSFEEGGEVAAAPYGSKWDALPMSPNIEDRRGEDNSQQASMQTGAASDPNRKAISDAENEETERWREERKKQRNYYGYPMPYAEGGEVKGDDTYVTGDQLAKQVEERFSQALETDDKYRRGYDDGGDVAAPAMDTASEEQRRRLQEEIERQRMAEAQAQAQAEAAAAAERAPAREAPAPEQAPPETERRTDPNDTSRLLPEPPELPPEQPAMADGLPPPAQPAAVADAQAQAEQQTNDWLSQVIDYSHSKVDPAEYGPQQPQQPQPEAARTGYAPEQTGGGRGPLMANMLPAMASMVAPGPATPPDNNAPVSEASGWGELLGAGAKAIGKGIVNQFARDPVPEGNTLSAAKMSIADLINGKDAINTPEQLGQIFERDPYGDHNARNQRAMDALEAKNDLEGAHKLSQAMRGPFNGSIAFARAANASDKPDAVARMLDHAHNFLTNKTLMKTVPTADGYDITLTSEKDGTAQKRFLTKDQMTDFLNSNGVQYDAMAKNSTLKHLDIATGRRGQFNTDVSSLPVSDETTGYTPQEPPMKQGAPRASDFTTVPPPAAPGAAPAAAPAAAPREPDPEALARATAHLPRPGTPASHDEREKVRYAMRDHGALYPMTPDQLQKAVEDMRDGRRRAIAEQLRPPAPPAAAPAPGPNTGYNRAADIGAGDIGGKPRHPAWEGLPVADKWQQGQGYRTPGWPNSSAGPEDYGLFARASRKNIGAEEPKAYPHNVPQQAVGPYIPAGGDQGALRIPPGGKPPPGWTRQNAEDVHEGSGWIALPPGVAPTQKDITMYNGAGQPVPMRVPDYWDPNKIKYSNEGRDSGQAVFPNPPGTKFNERGDAVRPISSYAPTLATPAPGREPGGPAPTVRGGRDFTGPQPWQPAYGPGVATVPPPAGDMSSDAVASRRNPASSQSGARAKEAQALDALASKESAAETAAAGRVGAADVTGQYRTAATGMQQAGAKERTGMQQAGAMDRTQANIAGRATAASQKFEDDMQKLETKEGHIDKRAAARDLTNRYKIETISSDKGREIAARALNARQQQDLSTYRTKIAQGAQHTPEEQAAYDTFRAEVARNGYRVPPPDDQAPAPAPAQAAPAAQAPAPGRGRLTVPPRGRADAGTAVNQTAQSMAGGQATAASAGAVDPRAIEYLRANPATRAQFDARYGSGLADSILGGR